MNRQSAYLPDTSIFIVVFLKIWQHLEGLGDLVLKCLMQPQIFQVALVLSSVVEGVLSNSSLSTAVT